MSDAMKLTPHDERRVAVLVPCDPRTVRARLAGKRTPPAIAALIDNALRTLGLAAPAAATPEGPKAA